MTRRLPLLVLLAAVASACDFQPTLDIDTPEHEERLVLRAVLAADSVAVVRVGRSQDPYGGRRYDRVEETPAGRVTLLRDGRPVEVLRIRSETCYDSSTGYNEETGEYGRPFECGAYVGTVPVEAGGTYTLRAEVAGLPTAEGTVTVPLRPTLTAAEEPRAAGAPRQFRLRLADPAGGDGRYGLAVLSRRAGFFSRTCEGEVCRDTSGYFLSPDRYPVSFETSDPTLVAAARQVPGDGIEFVTFTDQTFDGETFAFTIEVDTQRRYDSGVAEGPLTVQLAALSGDVYDAYQISYFSLGDDNPFAEPTNLPSNVVGGYGIVGAVALAEVAFLARDGRAEVAGRAGGR